MTVDDPAWEPLTESIDACFDDDLDRAENACLEALSRIRKRQAQEAR